MAQSTTACLTATDTSLNQLVNDNKELRRHRVAMLLIIERLEAELAVVQGTGDTCLYLVEEYRTEIAKCKQIYSSYDALIVQKNVVLAMDAQQIRLMKKEARLLRIKATALGITLPVVGAGVGAVVLFAVLTYGK